MRKSESDDEQKEEINAMERIRSIIKPDWIGEMYRKTPGSLTFRELVYLMIRKIYKRSQRIFIRIKMNLMGPKDKDTESPEARSKNEE